MPQVSLYFDDRLARVVTERADRDRLSVSKYVSTILYQHINDQWPDQFIESLGVLSDSNLARPGQPEEEFDAQREQL